MEEYNTLFSYISVFLLLMWMMLKLQRNFQAVGMSWILSEGKVDGLLDSDRGADLRKSFGVVLRS